MEAKKSNIYEKLSWVRDKVGFIEKKSSNPFFKNKYADINVVLETLNPVLSDVGIVFVQTPNVLGTGANVLTTRIINCENPEDFIEGHLPLVVAKNDMQQLGSAITYARRYALVSMFGLEALDDDGNVAVGNAKPQTKSQERRATIDRALEGLRKAKASDDVDKAIDIYNWGKDHKNDIIMNEYTKLFEGNNTEGM